MRGGSDVCSTEQAVQILGEVCRACNQVFERKISDAWLYGSYARGDFNEDSDVDILLTVDVEPEELPSYRKAVCHVCSDLGLKHGILVSPAIEPLCQFRRFQNVLPYYQNVVKEGIRYAER